jgi:hypothetical protein
MIRCQSLAVHTRIASIRVKDLEAPSGTNSAPFSQQPFSANPAISKEIDDDGIDGDSSVLRLGRDGLDEETVSEWPAYMSIPS